MNLLISYLLLLTGVFQVQTARDLTEKGVPFLRNFTPTEYNHRGKIWDIDDAPNGIVYMAADKGLLEYDGERWRGFNGSDGITRSVLVAADSLIYTGSDLDFGVWRRNIYNDFEYTSLYPFKEDLNQINEEFWNVHELDNNIFFISSGNIYVFQDQNLTKIPAPNEINNSFVVDGHLYFVDDEEGLFQLQNLTPVQILQQYGDLSFEIIGMYEQQDELFIVTQNAGLLQYRAGEITRVTSKLSESLKTANVFSFEEINESYLAFGTILEGVYISDLDGNVIHHITKNKGLQNNTVLSIHFNDAGKLWLAMDYGVSFLDLRNEFTFFYDYLGDFGTGYSAVLKNNEFYLGTNQGLYVSDWDDLNDSSDLNDFDLIPETEGQVWTLKSIDNRLWIGHDRGLFILDDGKVERLSDQRGFWTIKRYNEYLLAGTYNGISIFNKKGSEWRYDRQMELILGSCNQVIIEGENTIWVNIPNFGVIKASLNENLYPEHREIFLSKQFSGQDHFIRQSDEGIIVLTDEFEYRYDSDKNRFIEIPRSEIKTGIDDLLLQNAEPVRLNEEYEFFPVYNGFALRDLGREFRNQDDLPGLIFRRVEAYNNDTRMKVHEGAEVPHHLNNLRIVSVVPNQDDVLYQYKTDEAVAWSDWTDNGTFDLIGIGYGDHQLTARAMVNGTVTAAVKIPFIVATPWYRTSIAYLFYLIAVSLLFYLLYVWQGMSLSRQKQYLLMNQRNTLREQKERYRERLQRIEEDKLRAEYGKVKAQLKSKTIELATKAKENDEKQKILQTLNDKIKKLKQNPESLKRRSDEIQRIIGLHTNSEDNTFEIQIDELHQEFFERLRSDFDDLTRYDLRLCAYIKIGFDSKEIADLLNIKPSSVYISRSRLRKKLGLDSDEDLHAHLNSI